VKRVTSGDSGVVEDNENTQPTPDPIDESNGD